MFMTVVIVAINVVIVIVAVVVIVVVFITIVVMHRRHRRCHHHFSSIGVLGEGVQRQTDKSRAGRHVGRGADGRDGHERWE